MLRIPLLSRYESSPLYRGLMAFGSAEMINRVARILAVVVIARQVSPAMMGAAALALSLFEVVRVLTNAGIGQRVIAVGATQLDATCNTAGRLFWLWCLLVCGVQLLLAGALWLTGLSDIAVMLSVLAGVYLFMPAGLVSVNLLMREERFGAIARIATIQNVSDHLLTLILVLIWPSAWAIVLPKLCTAPLWLILARRARPWAPCSRSGYAPWRGFVGFGTGVLISELVNVGRVQLDKLIVGALFGVNALGIYYFAFNAGLGITTSFVMALGQVLFPYLCSAKDASQRRQRCRKGMRVALLVFLPILLAQVTLAPWYVPWVFGAQWTEAAPLVSVLGLGAIPMIFAAVASAWLRANDHAGIEAGISSASTAAALTGLVTFASWGLMASAVAYVAGLAMVVIPMALWLLSRRDVAAEAATPERSCV
ncbi:oligosaccharide flippase family protein [Salinicola aestuarinus]|uniref:oligosaccharide flippase family protein n=1 Tax=Salinicola aestuarinus TaxID=1949082 RepID=UPI000DA1BE2F|nr:oligosaccharide flippase family protein [Salinicola aestuarinus]